MAIAAEAAGALGTEFVRAAIDGTRIVGVAERATFLVFAVPVAAVLLSRFFAFHWLALPEAAIAVVAVPLSLWLGPLTYEAMKGLSLANLPDELAANVIWALSIFVVMAPAQIYVWKANGPSRIRALYAELARLTKGSRSSDIGRASLVRRRRKGLRRVGTTQTTRLVKAIDAWLDAWLVHQGELDQDVFGPLAADLRREMASLYGPMLEW